MNMGMTPAVEIFPWNRNFETGIELIDGQHKRLVELLNILVGHIAFQSDAPTLNKIFDELKDYTNSDASSGITQRLKQLIRVCSMHQTRTMLL